MSYSFSISKDTDSVGVGSESDQPVANENDKKRALDLADQGRDEESFRRKRATLGRVKRSRAFYAERQGERDSMQDRHVVIEDFGASISGAPADL